MAFLPPKTLIAGPCSVESEEQLFATAKLLCEKIDLKILRAGVWKPRTSPKSFEGLGEKALPWLANIKKELGLKVAIEVAQPRHIELALEYGIDMLWLGARTTVSPFCVQEIASSLEGVKEVSVLIKNPINPDIKLWGGAVERIAKTGIDKIALIHRGFSAPSGSLRYPPLWHLALEMKEKHPDLPFLCDPSHICGERESLARVSQAALNFGVDGLMLESHFQPEKAWSDSEQQMTPENLEMMLARLKWPSSSNELSFPPFVDQRQLELDQIKEEIHGLEKRKKKLLESQQKVQAFPTLYS